MNPGLLSQAMQAKAHYRRADARIKRVYGRHVHQHSEQACTYNPVSGLCWSDLDNRDALFTFRYGRGWLADVAIYRNRATLFAD